MSSSPVNEGDEDRPAIAASSAIPTGWDVVRGRNVMPTIKELVVDDRPERIRALFVNPPNGYK